MLFSEAKWHQFAGVRAYVHWQLAKPWLVDEIYFRNETQLNQHTLSQLFEAHLLDWGRNLEVSSEMHFQSKTPTTTCKRDLNFLPFLRCRCASSGGNKNVLCSNVFVLLRVQRDFLQRFARMRCVFLRPQIKSIVVLAEVLRIFSCINKEEISLFALLRLANK